MQNEAAPALHAEDPGSFTDIYVQLDGSQMDVGVKDINQGLIQNSNLHGPAWQLRRFDRLTGFPLAVVGDD